MRKRFVVVEALNQSHDTKFVCTFKSQHDSNDIQKATEVIMMDDVYNIFEYFGNLNNNPDNKHFIINEEFIFQCENATQRDLWIEKIIKTNNITINNNESKSKTNNNWDYQPIDTRDDWAKIMWRNKRHVFEKLSIINIPIKFKDAITCRKEYISLNIHSDLIYTPLCDIITNCVNKVKYPAIGESRIDIMNNDNNNVILNLDKWNSQTSNNYNYNSMNSDKSDLIEVIVTNGYYILATTYHTYSRHFDVVNINDKFVDGCISDEKKSDNDYTCNNNDHDDLCYQAINCPIYLAMKGYDHSIDGYNHFSKKKSFQ